MPTGDISHQDQWIMKVKGQKEIFQANGKEKRMGVAPLISDYIDFDMKKPLRHKGQHIMTKGYIQQEESTIRNV